MKSNYPVSFALLLLAGLTLLGAATALSQSNVYIGNSLTISGFEGADGTPPLVILGEYSPAGPLASASAADTLPAGTVQDVRFYANTYNFTLYALSHVSNGSHPNEQIFKVVASEHFVGTNPATGLVTNPVTGFSVNAGDLLAFAGTGPYYPQDVNLDATNDDATYENSTNPGTFLATPPGGVNSQFSVGIHLDTNSIYDYVSDSFHNQGRYYAIGVDVAESGTCPTITLNPAGSLTEGTAGCTYSGVTISASGGKSPYKYGLTGSADGLSINQSSGVLSGVPGVSGTFDFTVTATDTNNCTGSTNYTLTINCPNTTLIPAPGALPGGPLESPYSETITAAGGCTPYTFTKSSGSLPPGLSLSSGGTISGTPSAAGDYGFSITATETNGCGTYTNQYSLMICGNITLSPGTLPNGTEGNGYGNNDIFASGGGGNGSYTFTLTSGELPPGLSLSTGGTYYDVLSGTPSKPGTYTFGITATDNNGCTGTTNYTVTINCASISVSGSPPGFEKGINYSYQFSANFGDPPYGFTEVGSLPSGVSLSSSGLLSGTPNGTEGSYTFTVTATDTNGCFGTNSYTLKECVTFSAPGFSSGTIYNSYDDSVTVSGGTAPYAFQLISGSPPSGLGLSYSSTAITLSGTPNALGTSSFTLEITDADGCQVNEFFNVGILCPSIGLTPGSLPAAANGSLYNATIGESGGNGAFTYGVTSGALPNGLSLSSSGSLSGTPEAPPGIYNFTITGSENNDGCTGSQIYNLVLNCPSITLGPSSLPAGSLGVPYTPQQLSASGGDGPYTFSNLESLPPGLTLSSGGLLSGTPGAAGTVCFMVQATDTNGCTGTGNYCVTISGCNGPTVYKGNSLAVPDLQPGETFAPDTVPPLVILGEYNPTGPLSGSGLELPSGTIQDVRFYGLDYDFTLYALAPVVGGPGNDEQTFQVVGLEYFSGSFTNAGLHTLQATNFPVNCGNLLAFAGIGPFYPNYTLEDQLNYDATYGNETNNSIYPLAFTATSPLANQTFTVGIAEDTGATYDFIPNVFNNQGRYYAIGVDVKECGVCTSNCIGISCPGNIVTNTCNGSLAVSYVAEASDICATNPPTVVYDPPSGSLFGVGMTPVTATAYDSLGDTDTCSFTVTVLPGNCCTNCFNLSNFSSNSLLGINLQLNGSAAAPVIGAEGTPVLRLTPAAYDQSGSAFLPVQLGGNLSFNTSFAFQMTNGGGTSNDGNQPPEPPGADGIVFVLAAAPTDIGVLGEGVGYQGIPASVGIKFDTWQDGVANGFPGDSDPNGNFVAVYTDGNIQTAGYMPYSPANPTTTLQYYTPSTYMKNGDIWYAWIDYDGASGELDVRLSDGVDVRPPTPQLIQTLSLNNLSFIGPSGLVFAGFSSGTGGQYDDNDILNWQFCSPCSNACLTVQSSNLVVRTCGSCTNVPFSETVSYTDLCCTNVTLEYNYPTNFCFPVNSTNMIQVVAVDTCGNVVSNYFSVTVIPCTQTNCLTLTLLTSNLTVTTCNQCTPVSFANVVSYNDACCPDVSLYYYPSNYCFPAGTTTPVQVTAVDVCGNVASRVFTVTVLPCPTTNCLTIQCSNIVVQTCNQCATVPFTKDPTYSDPCCSNVTLVYNYPTNYCFPLGSTTPIEVAAVDACNNVATNLFTVTVVPCSATNCLTVLCSNIVVLTCSNCTTVPFTATYSDACCSNAALVYDYATNHCFEVNTTNTVEVVAYDSCGNLASNSFTVTVLPGVSSLNIAHPATGQIVLSWTSGILQSAPVVTGPYVDVAGATSPYVTHATFPETFYRLRCACPTCTNCISIDCPGNITLVTCSNSVVFNDPVGVTDFCTTNYTVFYNPPLGTLLPLGVTTVGIVVTDVLGNTNVCSFNLSVLSGKQTVSVGNSLVVSNGAPDFAESPLVILGEYSSAGPLAASPTGIPVGGTLEDVRFYGRDYQFTLYVLSHLAAGPGADEQTFQVVGSQTFAGTNSAPGPITNTAVKLCVNQGDLIAFDGYGPYYPQNANDLLNSDATYDDSAFPESYVATPPAGGSGPVFTVGAFGDAAATYDYIDDREFMNQGRTYGLAVDVLPTSPCSTCSNCISINCNSNITVTTCSNGAAVNFSVSAIDQCTNKFNVISVPASGSVFPLGKTIVNSTAIDALGNSAQCSFTVAVMPCTPTNCLTVQASNLVFQTCNQCTAVPFTANVSYSDTCCSNVSLNYSLPTNYCFAVNTTTPVQVVAYDSCENIVSNTFTVSVVPCVISNSCLTLACPTNIFVTTCSNSAAVSFASAVSGSCSSNVTLLYAIQTEGYIQAAASVPVTATFTAGTTPIVVYALDAAANVLATCDFSVTVSNLNCNAAADLIQWTFEVSQPSATLAAGVPLSNIAPELGSGTASAVHQGAATYSSPAGNGSDHSFSANTWAVGDYFEFACPIANALVQSVAWDQASSATGPGFFQLQYSTDGANFYNFGESYPVGANGTLSGPTSHWGSESNNPTTHHTQDLSSISALSGATEAWFRLVDTSTNNPGGGPVGPFGTSRIDNFTLSGVLLAGTGETPEVNWAESAPITYGTPLGGEQLNATANVPGTFTYSPPAGTVLTVGSNFLSAIFTPASGGNSTTSIVNQLVLPSALTLAADNATWVAGEPNPPFTGTILGALNSDNIAVTWTCSATLSSPPGEYPIIPGVVTANPGALKNYSIIAIPGTGTTSSNNCGCVYTNLLWWTFEVSRPSESESAGVPITGIYPEYGTGVASALHQGATDFSHPSGNGSTNSFSSTNWAVGDYYEFACSNISLCGNLSATWDQVSSATGPGTFQMLYSLDGINFLNFGQPYHVNVNGQLQGPAPYWNYSTRNYTTHYIQNLNPISEQPGLVSTIWIRLMETNEIQVGTNWIPVIWNPSADGNRVGSSGSSRVDNFMLNGTRY